MIKAVFFDIDGTLVSFDTHRIPDSALAALLELRANGTRLFIASGRSPDNLPYLQDQMPFAFDGYALMNGQYCVTREGEVLRRQALPAESFRMLLPWLEESGTPCTFMEADRAYMNLVNDVVRQADAALGFGGAQHKTDNPARALAHTTYQLSAFVRPEQEAEFLRHMPGAEAVRWCPYFADIIPAGGGKPMGMRVLCGHYGIGMDETMAFGDGGNDIAMLQAAAIGVAMGNGGPEVQAAADYVTAPIDEDGLALALCHFGLIEG